jgi:DNA-binding CsgD family transcriptional regulator
MRHCYSKTTKRETEVLHLLTKEFETPKQVAIRLQISDKRVYQIIKNLKKKGLITGHFQAIEKVGGSIQGGINKKLRLHGQQFHIQLIYRGDRFKDKVSKLITVDGNSIMVYRDSIEVYSNTFFFGSDVDKVTADSLRYWTKLFVRLESELDCIILKPRVDNIKLVKQGEYAEVNNELAIECKKQAEKIRVYSDDDGKLWFQVDNSFNMDEAETVHPVTSKRDMGDIIKPFMNTLRNNPNVLEDLFKAIRLMQETQGVQAQLNKETAAGLSAMVELLKPKEFKDDDFEVLKDKPSYIG